MSVDGIFLARAEPRTDGPRFAVKDLFDTAGLVTTYGSPIFGDHLPADTAPAVRLAEGGGYVVVGKTNLHEFAYGTTSENPHFGVVPNPRAPGRVAGGSSGGSAAALAAGLADAALGSDTGGSIRIPAACCGVVGLKPTYGLVPLEGCFPLAPSFDHAGPMARTVAECAELTRALVPDLASNSLLLSEVHVGVAWLALADGPVRLAVERAVAALPGAEPADFPFAEGVGRDLMREVADVHRDLFAEHGELYGEDVRIKVERCLAVSDGDVAAAAAARGAYRERAAEALAGFDLLLTPTLPVEPPRVGRDAPGDLDVREQLIRFTFPFNALGWPALALPCHLPGELPVSLQLVGRPGDDALVLAAGEALERALQRR